ncbi:MAG: hypothetical protein IJJ99_02695 [Oscillospiraceae bacterium]|nr:hypothetical protein [Oscillospiraceae bacterium]
MRTGKRLIALLLAFALAATLAACAAQSPSGTYTAVRLVKGGKEADAAALAAEGAMISITFEPDGTGVLRFNAGNEPFRWSGNSMTSQEGDTMEFRFDGKTLTLERGDTLIEFR